VQGSGGIEVVADADDEVGHSQEAALHLPARSMQLTARGMIFVNHPVGHGRGGER
jgi:hypothetical protein